MDKIILTDNRSNGVDFQSYLVRQSKEFEDIPVLDKPNLRERPDIANGANYVFSTWNMPTFSEKEIAETLPSLEALFYAAGDTQYFAAPFEANGIKVFDCKLENALPVAEFVLGQILLANKGYFQAQRTYEKGLWWLGFHKARRLSLDKPGNNDTVIGLIGLGAVARRLVALLKPFELRVVAYDPYVSDDEARAIGVSLVLLEELFETSDVVSNHLPDTEETNRLLDYRLFSLMRPKSTFINTGRGRQVNEIDLARAMKEGPTRLALLDVTSHEPPFPGSPLYRRKNILMSPHIAGSQAGEMKRMYRSMLEKYEAYHAKRCVSFSGFPGD